MPKSLRAQRQEGQEQCDCSLGDGKKRPVISRKIFGFTVASHWSRLEWPAMKHTQNQKAAKADNVRTVSYTKAEREEILRDAKASCRAAGIRPTEGNLRRVITDELGQSVAEQLFSNKATAKGGTRAKLEEGAAEIAKLQKAVAVTEKKIKSAPKKTIRKLGTIYGHSMIAVARALGKAGFKPAAAVAAIHKHEPNASVAAIKTFVQAGRHSLRGAPAPLTKKQIKELAAVAA